MSDILNSIQQAQAQGAGASDILNEITKQNPGKASVIQQARQSGANDDDILNEIKKQNQPAPTTGQKVLQFGSNLLSSAGNFVGGLGNAIIHPINTAQGLGQLGAGLIDKAAYALGPAPQPGELENQPGYIQQNRNVADAVVQNYKQRYGSLDQAKQTAYQDPVGAMGDLSMLFSLGGSALGVAGEASNASKLAQFGRYVTDAGEAANPASLAIKGVAGTAKVGYNLLPDSFTNNLGNKAVSFLTNTPIENFNFASNPETAPLVEQVKPLIDNPEQLPAKGKQIFAAAKQAYQQAQDDYGKAKEALQTNFSDNILEQQPQIQQGMSDVLGAKGTDIHIGPNGHLDFSGSPYRSDAAAQELLQNAYNAVQTTGDVDEMMNQRQVLERALLKVAPNDRPLTRILTQMLKQYDGAVDEATKMPDPANPGKMISMGEKLRSDYAKIANPTTGIIDQMVDSDGRFSADRAATFVKSVFNPAKFDNTDLLQQLDQLTGKNFTQEAKAYGVAKALSRLDPPTQSRVSDILRAWVVGKTPGFAAFVSPKFWGEYALQKGLPAAGAAQLSQVATRNMVTQALTQILKTPVTAGKFIPALGAIQAVR